MALTSWKDRASATSRSGRRICLLGWMVAVAVAAPIGAATAEAATTTVANKLEVAASGVDYQLGAGDQIVTDASELDNSDTVRLNFSGIPC